MTISVIRHADHVLVPWKNGLGMTREVANAHRADGSLLWRISLATVDRDGPFSDFAGCKRIIMMLSGDGMTLDFGPHGRAVMHEPFVPVIFDGGWQTSATLHGGPTRDLNVVTSHQGVRSAVEVLRIGAQDLPAVPGPGLTVLFVLDGRVGAGDVVLEQGDALRMDGAREAVALHAADGRAVVYRIDIDLA